MSNKLPFSADGIRGIANSWPLNRNGCISLGKALGDYIKSLDLNPLVMVARDTRPSSPLLYGFLRSGLISKGIAVQDLDIITTPALAYLVKNSSASLGLMVTASHNPVEFNGIKVIDGDGKRLSDEKSASIENFLPPFENQYDVYPECPDLKSMQGRDSADKYINDQIAQSNIKSLKGLRLVIDCANGATSYLIPKAFIALGATVHSINQYDGKNEINSRSGTEFFRRHPSELASIVQKHEANYGISFDGDGDRLIIIDHSAKFYNGDDFLFVLGTIFSQLGNLNKKTLVTTHMANSGLLSSLNTLGVNVVQTRNGDRYLEEEIVHNGYNLGGEQFGNIIIHDDYHIAADPFYTLLHMLNELKTSTLSDLLYPLKKLPQVLVTVKTDTQNNDKQLNEQVESIIDRLGLGSRVRMWHSTTQPGLFNFMIEGTQACTIEMVLNEARKLCSLISGQNDYEPIIIPLSERVY